VDLLWQVLSCLSTLVELGLLTRHTVLEKLQAACPLLFHPSAWIRHELTHLIATVARSLGFPDTYVFLVPILRPYIRYDLLGAEVNEKVLQEALKTPISRAGFRAALAKQGK